MLPSPVPRMLTIAAILAASQALAETSPQATELDRVHVQGRRDSTPAAPTLAVERERLARVPGGSNLVDLRETGRQGTLRDVLDYQPGLVVQDFFGGIDQPRLNVRGSGIQSNPVNRGITLLQDGLPLNEADTSFVIGLIEQRNTAFVSARRGANAITPSATTLGGEIEFHSMTGTDERGRLRLEGGSFGKRGGQLAVGGAHPRADWRLSASHDENDGYRHHSDGKRRSVQMNSGWWLGDTFANRLWLTWTDLFFHIPNVLPKSRIHSDPRGVLGDGTTAQDTLLNVYRRDPLRDTQQWRIANRSEWGSEHTQQSLGAWWQQVDDLFKNPTTHNVRSTSTRGVQYQLSGGQTATLDYRLGAAWMGSSGTRTLYANSPQTGTRLHRFGHYDLDASSVDLLASVGWRASNGVHLMAESKWSRARRDAHERSAHQRQALTYTHASPRLGLVWQRDERLRLFANLSRSNEVPSWWEIISADVPANNPAAARTTLQRLRTQTADTLEVGGNGQVGGDEHRLDWQLALYRSAVDDELMAMVDEFGIRTGTFNYAAGSTHQGVEAGLNGHWLLGPVALDARMAWTYSDFRFDGGQFSGHQIAGVPKHLISTEVLLNLVGWRLGPTLRWLPSITPTDHANTRDIYQDSYALLGFKLDYTTPDGHWQVFVHADNLTDRRYASSYAIRNQATLAQPGFLPGVGRNASLGITWRF